MEEDSARAALEGQRIDQSPYHLDQVRRDAVLEAIQEVCAHRGWSLLAAHVRSNHVHTVVVAEVPPTEYQTPKGLSQHRKNAAPLLASAGIEIQFRRSPGGGRPIELRLNPCVASSQNRPQDAAQTTAAIPQPTESEDLKAA